MTCACCGSTESLRWKFTVERGWVCDRCAGGHVHVIRVREGDFKMVYGEIQPT